MAGTWFALGSNGYVGMYFLFFLLMPLPYKWVSRPNKPSWYGVSILNRNFTLHKELNKFEMWVIKRAFNIMRKGEITEMEESNIDKSLLDEDD